MSMERHEIQHYLRSNVSITGEEPHTLRQMVQQARVNLRTKQMATGASKRKFESDEAELKIAEERLFALRSLRAPINRLPAELLGHLFFHCLPTTENATMNPDKAPLVLGRVCKRWREIVYNERILWASLHIVIPERSKPIYDTNYKYPKRDRERFESQSRDRYRKLLERFVSFVLAWIHRSGSTPLSISLSMTFAIKRWPGDDPSFQTLNHGILSVCERWSHVEMYLLEGELSNTIASLLPSQVPLLKSLKIRFIGGSAAHCAVQWNTSTVFKARNLSVLFLEGPPSKTQNTPVDWGQLTDISICERFVLSSGLETGVLSVSEAYDLLTNCTRIVQCTLHIYDQRTAQPHPEKDIHLPHLRSLSLVDGSPNLRTLVGCLKTPSLQSLSFHRMLVVPFEARSADYSSLYSLVQLNKNVKHLTIDTQFTYGSEITNCFQCLPSITHFRSQECSLGISLAQTRSRNNSRDQAHGVISRLQLRTTTYSSWPRLESIILHSGRNFTDKVVRDLIEKRFDAHEKYGSALLTHVDVIPGQFLPSEGFSMDSVMSRYKAKGISLNFSLQYLPQPREEVKINPDQGLGAVVRA